MRLDILTLFPEMFVPLQISILERAQKTQKLSISIKNIRDFSKDKHKKCDDYTFGGGPGMLMMAQPIFSAFESIKFFVIIIFKASSTILLHHSHLCFIFLKNNAIIVYIIKEIMEILNLKPSKIIGEILDELKELRSGGKEFISNYEDDENYLKLKEVEFKSFTAPLLEDYYNADSVLPETAPGFDKLHNQFDLFGYELYYYNFKDLIGVNDPILMTVPANDGLIGYDNLLYEVYFGKLSEAKRSNEYTMDKNMVDFISFAKKIKTLNVITLADERLINDALTAYNGVKQNPADFNINIDEWNDYVSCVTNAKVILSALKLSKASKEVQNLQLKINQLPDKFDISMLETLKTISNEINKTKQNEKSLLDLTKYNQLVSSYSEYVKNISAEIEPVIGSVNNTLVFVNIATAASIATLAFVILKRRWL